MKLASLHGIDKHNIIIPLRLGAMAASGKGDGKLIPVVMYDIKREEVNDLIKNHEESQGDVISYWTKWPFLSNVMILILEFKFPMVLRIGIKFSLKTDIPSIDLIIQSKGLYLQPCQPGKTLSESLSNFKILIEIPPKTHPPDWDNFLQKIVFKNFKKKV